MGQRWLTWVVALLLIAGVTTVALVFLLQGDGPPDYQTVFTEAGEEKSPSPFKLPAGLTVDSSGNLFVMDTGNSRIVRLSPEGKRIGDLPPAPGSETGHFTNALRMRMSSEGILCVADTDNHRLQTFDSKLTWLAEYGSLGQEAGQFSHPIGLAYDPSGNLWVADSGNHRVQKFGPGLKNVLTIIPSPSSPKALQPGTGNGEFNTPWGVACDATGTLYVADTKNNRIQRFAKNGDYISSWGTFGNSTGEFNLPTDLIVDRMGNVFVVDSGNNRIQKFDGQGKYLCEWGKKGTLAREFNNPQQIAESPSDGTIYVADTNNNRIHKYRPRKSPLFHHDDGMAIPTKPRAPGPKETPLNNDLPEVPSDNPSSSGTPSSPASPQPEASGQPETPATQQPEPEPTRF